VGGSGMRIGEPVFSAECRKKVFGLKKEKKTFTRPTKLVEELPYCRYNVGDHFI